jgi:hypothetical protein
MNWEISRPQRRRVRDEPNKNGEITVALKYTGTKVGIVNRARLPSVGFNQLLRF